MLHLLRKFRKKLLDQSQIQRYLLYAIGEIFLVVIGILIALQINNWNEQQKSNEKERLLLINLQNDFVSRYTELKELNEARKEAVEILLILNDFIAEPENLPEEEQLDSLLAITMNSFLFNEQFKMLDVLFSTGMINELSNQELKNGLLSWPQLVEEMLEEQRGLSNEFSTYYNPLIYKYLSNRKIYEKFYFRGYNLPVGPPTTLSTDYEGLFADRNFENYVANAESYLRVNIIDGNNLVIAAEKIIELLDLEINRL